MAFTFGFYIPGLLSQRCWRLQHAQLQRLPNRKRHCQDLKPLLWHWGKSEIKRDKHSFHKFVNSVHCHLGYPSELKNFSEIFFHGSFFCVCVCVCVFFNGCEQTTLGLCWSETCSPYHLVLSIGQLTTWLFKIYLFILIDLFCCCTWSSLLHAGFL